MSWVSEKEEKNPVGTGVIAGLPGLYVPKDHGCEMLEAQPALNY